MIVVYFYVGDGIVGLIFCGVVELFLLSNYVVVIVVVVYEFK